jgi:primary-amine oxidase
VLFDVWAYGAELVPDHYCGRRVAWTDVWHRASAGANPYANALSGMHPIVDLNTMTLLELDDHDVGAAPPQIMGEYIPHLVPGLQPRDDLRPLVVSQPDGASLTLDGHLLRWQRWSMRLGFNYREGLVIHTVGYEDGSHVRKVAHRLSFSEMVVPYRDPTPEHYRPTAFDIGEWGLGPMTTSLELAQAGGILRPQPVTRCGPAAGTQLRARAPVLTRVSHQRRRGRAARDRGGTRLI